MRGSWDKQTVGLGKAVLGRLTSVGQAASQPCWPQDFPGCSRDGLEQADFALLPFISVGNNTSTVYCWL